MIKVAEQPDTLLRRMGSLADATRLRVLRLLEQHELGVVELCDVLQMPQSTVSRHLKLLAGEGWIVSRRQGTTNFYRMILDELDEPARQLWVMARQEVRAWPTLHQDQLRLARRLSQRPSDSQAFFADAAGQWDRLREQMYGSSFSTEALLGLLPADWTVADLGCGTGSQSVVLSRFVKRVIAVDNSAAMLAAAKQRTADLDNIEVLEGELTSLPIDDAACDAALMVLVLAYLPDPSAALAEMSRILKPGGRGVVVALLRHDRDDFCRRMGQLCMGFEPEQLDRMLTKAGLASIRIDSIPPEPDARGPALLLATADKPCRA